MEHYLLIARSVTHAQQMEKALEKGGIHAKIRRAGAKLTGRGCSYVLEINAKEYERSMAQLVQFGQKPIRIFYAGDGELQEVIP